MRSRNMLFAAMRWIVLLSLTIGLSVSIAAADPLQPFADEDIPTKSSPLADTGLSFVPNQGQSAQDVQFQANGDGASLFFTADAMTFALSASEAAQSNILKLKFESAN